MKNSNSSKYEKRFSKKGFKKFLPKNTKI